MDTQTAIRRRGRKRGHGEGTIYQHATRGWVAQLSVPGKKRKTYYGKSRREVDDKLLKAQADVQRGLPLPDERQTVAAFLDTWLHSIALGRVRPSAFSRYSLDVRRINGAIGRVKLSELTPQP